jgi:cytochrome P450
MLEDADKDDDETLEMIKDVAGLTYLAGADTTVAAVTSFFLAMVIYPEVQRRAQAELNAVVGRDRLPEFSDQERLPYVKAVMSECLRWLPVLPVGKSKSQMHICASQFDNSSGFAGVPHSTAEDDTYRGCFIPKGTIVFPLQWALLHDTVTYPDPEEFVPERYLHRLPSGAWTERSDVRNPRDFSFGFGRRACPGTHIAEQSLFASVATALHTLDIQRRQDPQGNEIVPKPNVSGGLLSHPKPFDYVIKMRDDATELVQMCRRS